MRFKRTFHSISSSYFLLAGNALYSLGSVPVALYYLNKSEFGLWVLMATIIGYITLIDLGMSSAASRLLVDCKDYKEDGNYGSLIQTEILICSIQGGIILMIGFYLSGSFAKIIGIPLELTQDFIKLMKWQFCAVSLSFSTKIFVLILGSHQRMDIVNYSGIFSLFINFTIQWISFHLGYGVLSLAFGSLSAVIILIPINIYLCKYFNLFPGSKKWGRISWIQFKTLFMFGKDILFVSLGTQMILASQTIIITRTMGLEAAAI